MKYLENTSEAIQNYKNKIKKYRSTTRISKRQKKKTIIILSSKKKRDKSLKK